jgi:dienelactone hydrolase
VRLDVLRTALETHGSTDALARVVFEPQTMRAHVVAKAVAGGVPPPGWRTFEVPRCLRSANVKAPCAPPWPVADVGTFEVAKESTQIGDVTLTRVAFDSPAPSGHAKNDRVHGAWYRPKEAKAAVITLPAWKDPNLAGQGMVALQLARRGYAVLVLPLPWQADRTPEGVSSGSWTLSADLARTRAAMLQGAADVARASLWIEEQGFPATRQGVMGLSLGGHAAALAFGAYPERFGAGVFLLAGGRLQTAMLNENRVTRRMRKVLVERGVTPEEATDLIHDVDGVTWAKPERRAHVLLVGADQDDVIPPANVRALAEAYGGARTEWIPGDHLSILLHLPRTIDWVVGHLDATIGQP